MKVIAHPKLIAFSTKQALVGALFVSLLINSVLMMGIYYGRAKDLMIVIQIGWSKYLSFFCWHFTCNLAVYFLLFLYNFRVVKRAPESRKRALKAILGTFLICLLVSPFLSRLLWRTMGGASEFGMNGFIVFNLVTDMIVGIIIILITSTLYMTLKRQQVIIANQKLMEENIRIRYEALKNQLDPHFLFNSLNTLNGLIGIDDEKAHDYVDNLSSVFRYTLHSKTIVKLEEEIEYADSYTTLLKIRYGDNMRVSYNIDSQYKEHYVIPASLQLLVENAVKHNVITNKTPLTIYIESTPHATITVSNRMNPKEEKSIGGLGLANLTERYAILFGKDVDITNMDGVFCVEIPLISQIEKGEIV